MPASCLHSGNACMGHSHAAQPGAYVAPHASPMCAKVYLSAPAPVQSPACCCAQLEAHTEHGYARQFIRGFKVADLVGSMGDLFDAALGDPSHSPLAALQAYGHAPPAAAQLDPSQVSCATVSLIMVMTHQASAQGSPTWMLQTKRMPWQRPALLTPHVTVNQTL